MLFFDYNRRMNTRNLKIAIVLGYGFIVACIMIPVLLYAATPAHAANTSACYSVGDADARAYCLAKAHREPSICYSIIRADMRAMCLAETRK